VEWSAAAHPVWTRAVRSTGPYSPNVGVLFVNKNAVYFNARLCLALISPPRTEVKFIMLFALVVVVCVFDKELLDKEQLKPPQLNQKKRPTQVNKTMLQQPAPPC
jgi:hypothetical protein